VKLGGVKPIVVALAALTGVAVAPAGLADLLERDEQGRGTTEPRGTAPVSG
jgi:hypothetical protein